MKAQEYLKSKLEELSQPLGLEMPKTKDELAEVIFKLVTTKKFRKYSAAPELLQEIRQAIRLNIENNEPISVVSSHGMYKLWRLAEAPEADWAELFTFMYYTTWLKGICEIYEPGVWFDFYTDDLLVPKINNILIAEVWAYQASYQKVLDFLEAHRPANFKMTVTTVGSRFESEEAFYKKLEVDTTRLAQELPHGLPELDEKRITTIELNARPSDEQKQDSQWREKVALIHDAYLAYTKPETKYHFESNKIRTFTTPLSSKRWLAVGTTKDSIMKFWVGAGVLQPRDDSFRQIIFSPSQLEKSQFITEEIQVPGLEGKNFHQIKIIQ